jgi:hypothetical protein
MVEAYAAGTIELPGPNKDTTKDRLRNAPKPGASHEAIFAELPVATTDEIALAEHAAVIRALGKRVVGDIIEIGRRLDAARDLLKEEGRWRKWLDTELRWSPQTAGRFIQVFEASGKHSNLEHLAVPVSGLYLLAAPSTPDEAQQDIIARAESGDRLSVGDVRRIIDCPVPRSPAQRARPQWTAPQLTCD